MKIISRPQWGAKAWRGTPYSTPLSSRTHFLVHYHGGPPPQSEGPWVPKNVEAIHLGNGWSGTGYNFMVGQDGKIYEGRGWSYVGAHCPGMNTKGIGVYVAIGGNQQPSEAAKRSVRWLYDEANRKTGRTLYKSWHGNHYATACPGPHLIAWVKAGMPATGTPGTPSTGSTGSTEGELSMSDIKQIMSKLENIDEDVFKVAKDVKTVNSRTKNALTWGRREALTPATAEAIGWGSRKNPTMTVGGQIMTTLRLAADAASGVKRTEREMAQIADDIEALVKASEKDDQ